MSEIKDTNIQDKIYKFLANNAGVHLSEIAKMLNYNISTLESYLFFMEKSGTIKSFEVDGYKKYYVIKASESLRDQRSEDIKFRIQNLIEKNPGLHLSKIAELLDMRVSHAEYYLLQMQKNNRITAIKDTGGHYKRYYLKDHGICFEEKEILGLLRQDIRLKIVAYLLMKSKLRHTDLLQKLEITSSTLSFHITKMVHSGIIEVKTYGIDRGYKLKNKKKIIGILIKYGLYLVIEDFKDVWIDFSLKK